MLRGDVILGTPRDLLSTSSAHDIIGFVTYDMAEIRPTGAGCLVVSETARPQRGTYVRLGSGPSTESYVGRIIDGPFTTKNPGAFYLVELISMELMGQRTAVRNKPSPGTPVLLLPPDEIQVYIGAVGDFTLGRLVGQPDVKIAIDSSSLNRHIGIFGTTGTGKSNTLQVIAEEASRVNRSVLMFDVEGEYPCMNEPTDALKDLLAEFGKRPEGLKNLQVFVPAPNSSRNIEARKFGIPFADLDLEIFSEVLGLSPMERIYMFDIARKAKDISGSFQEYGIAAVLKVLKKRIDAQVDKASLPEAVTEAHMGLYTKLTVAERSGIIDAHQNGQTFDRIPIEQLCGRQKVTVIDVSESSDFVRNICIAHLLKEIFRFKTRHLESAPILVFIEEIHTFLSKAKRRTMTATLTMLTEMARQGRKRGIGLGLVSQQPALVPSELIELCNTRFMHRISSEPNIDVLRKSTGNVPDPLWAILPSLGNGEVLIASPKFNHSVIAKIRPNMSKRLRVEYG